MKEKVKEDVSKRLNRLEGQIRGIKKMVEEDRYCIDILTQLRAVISALGAVEDAVMRNHLSTCVYQAMKSGNDTEKDEKIDEVMGVFSMYRRNV